MIATIAGRLFLWIQYLAPHHLLSRVVYAGVRWTWRPWKNLLILGIARIFRIDTGEAAREVPGAYRHFNDFFTRELVAGARPVAGGSDIACPSDGTISQLGSLERRSILQAKGRQFSLDALVAGRRDLSDTFEDGRFMTVYLAPRDYHRVHMPLKGKLLETIFVPGRLFSVSPLTTEHIPDLFARNERLICRFHTPAGDMLVIMVGAMLVSSIETVWAGECPRGRQVVETRHDGHPALDRGAELGRFNMGSTVIVVFPAGAAEWLDLTAEQSVRMGQPIGRILDAAGAGR